MIKTILITMALLSLSLCAKAQDLPLFLSGHNDVGIVPGEFTSDASDQLYTYPLTEKKTSSDKYAGVKHFNLYDYQLNPICSISADDGIIPFSHFVGTRKIFLYVTQSLFDSDSKYEYISALSLDVNDYVDYLTGIKIQNEDGEILAEIPFGDGWRLCTFYNTDEEAQPIRIFRLSDKGNSRSYICLDLWRDNGNYDMGEESITRIYAFEEGKISTSIKKIRDISTRMKVTPVMPRRNEIVSVDISSVQSPTSLTVVSAAGQVVCSQNLHDGQKNASIDTSRLTSGLYIVRVANSNKEYENCRIIIR